MNRKPTARILNLDLIVPHWKDYAAGFYSPPDYASSDLLIFGVHITLSRFEWEEMKRMLLFYSEFMDRGCIHAFLACREYGDLVSDSPKHDMEGTRADECIRMLKEFRTDLPYTGTLLVTHYQRSIYYDGVLLADMLHQWGNGQHPCQSAPPYRPDRCLEKKAQSTGHAHFYLSLP